MLSSRWRVRIKPQHRAEMPKRIPRQHMSTLRAMNTPPSLGCIDTPKLIIANA
jgi:hypothetical protein